MLMKKINSNKKILKNLINLKLSFKINPLKFKADFLSTLKVKKIT